MIVNHGNPCFCNFLIHCVTAVKVKPFSNRLFAPACVAMIMRNAFKKLYLIRKRVVFNAKSVLGNGGGLGYGDSYDNIKALDSVPVFSVT